MTTMIAKTNEGDFDLQVLKKRLLSGSTVELKVASDSMVPLLKVGEIVQVKKHHSIEELSHFDLIVFEQANQLNIHFLSKIDLNNQLLVTRPLKRPDSNDYPIHPNQVLGIVPNKKLSLWQKLRVLLVS